MTYIKRCTNLGVVHINTSNSKMVLENDGELIQGEKEIFRLFEENRVPIKVQYEMTERCNFECYYCYAKKLRYMKELSTKQVKTLIDKFYDIGIIFLELTGGEVLMREDITEILDYLYEKQFVVSIFTNLSLLTKEILEHMKCVSIINTSLLAPDNQKCDKLTACEGAYEKILENVKMLKNSNIKLTVQTTITRENVEMYSEYKELEDKLGIKFCYNLDVGPTFDGYECVEKYSLNRDYIDTLKNYFGPRYVENAKKFFKDDHCSIGKSKFAIDCEGNIIPCLKYRTKIGEILNDNFEDLWNSEVLLSIKSKVNFKEYKTECIKCSKRDYCLPCIGIVEMYNDSENKCRQANLLYEIEKCGGN